MRLDDIDDKFDVDIPLDEPVFPVHIVCELLNMQYYTLHEIIREGILRVKKKRTKKLFSHNDMKRLKYVQYLIVERGVNVKGVKVIFEIEDL